MVVDILNEIHKDLFRERLSKYTRKALQMLPELDKPHILDIGCGSGVPTLELARLTNGQIIGLDIHQPYLDELNRKIQEAGLSDRVRTVKCSMFELDFQMKASTSSGPRDQYPQSVSNMVSWSGDAY